MTQLAPDQVNNYIVKKLIQNLVIECSSSTQVVISSGSTAGADDGAVVMEAASNITIDITNSGVNGLDTGTEASDTWYYIYMIYNPTTETVSGLLSTSATSPTMPSGYAKKRLVGAVRNDGSSNFRNFVQRDHHLQFGRVSIGFVSGQLSWTGLSLAAVVPLVITDEVDISANGYSADDSPGLRSDISYDGTDAGTVHQLYLQINGIGGSHVKQYWSAFRFKQYDGNVYIKQYDVDDSAGLNPYSATLLL